jgi:hypothetical protein
MAVVRQYWMRICREAWREALRALALDSPERALLRITAAVIGVAVVWWATNGATTSDLVFRVIGSVAVLALFPVVFFWKCLAVSAGMDFETRKALNDLRLSLDNKEQRMTICRAIAKFIVSGQEILDRCTYIGKPIPKEAVDRWETEVQVFIIENLDEIFFAKFCNFSDIPQGTFGRNSEPHEELWQGMRARLSRLHQYMQELRPPP